MKRARTLKDIAELAGVTSGTVSRALAGSNLVLPATREHIVALAKTHGFTPNASARSLRTRRTGVIGVLIPLGHETAQRISDPFFMTMFALLADTLSERGYNLLLSRVLPTDDDWLTRFSSSGQADGIIVIGQSDQIAALDALSAHYRPLVVWGAHVAGQAHCTVGSDNVRGGRLATQHLIERGCRRIAFFGDPRALEIGQRLTGCREAMAQAGLSDQLDVVPAHLFAEGAHPDITAWLSRPENRPPENRSLGIVAASDVIAMSALRALAEFGLAVPDQVKVIGYDGLDLGEHTAPRLTTIAQDLSHGARQLVDIVIRQIAGEDCPSVILPQQLIIRKST